ncbi:MAG: extracellular solute-binding protein [Anaerolineales bacterium]|nr:extracellular solute-binding protein [Anaerolineales bacterium]
MLNLRTFVFIFLLGCLLAACTSEQVSIPVPTLTPSPEEPTSIVTPPQPATATLEPPAPTAEPAVPGVSEEDLRGQIVRFWHPWSGDKEFVLLALVNQFNASNPHGITVVAFSQGSDLYTNLRASLGTELMPEVVMAYSNQIHSWDYYGGRVVDLRDFLQDPQWGFSPQELADYYAPFWEHTDLFETKLLGLPAYRSAMVLFYNASWAQELGYPDSPNMPSEFAEQACAAATTRGTGLLVSSDVASTLSWMLAFGGGVLDSAGQGYEIDTPENQAAFEFMKDLLEDGCAEVPAERYPNAAFADRQGLFYASSMAGLPFQQAAFEKVSSQDRWLVLPFPGVEGQPVLNVYGGDYALLADAPASQLASWLFIRWMSQPENQAQWVISSAYLPTRVGTLAYLDEYLLENPHYQAAIALIPYSRSEPTLGSWGVARYALSDGANQLFDPDFPADQIPSLLAEIEQLMVETHLQNR